MRETIHDADARVALVTPLGFGHANVVVAVPEAWIDVRTMADLEDVAAAYRSRRGTPMRVATKYVNLTRAFFAQKGVGDYRIVESLGATEGAPAAGQAELIVDITTTGATLRANALKVLEDGTILKSQANLAAAVTAPWSEAQKTTARALLARIAAEEEAPRRARGAGVVTTPCETLASEAAASFGATSLGVGAGVISLLVPQDRVAALADWLVAQGADPVAVTPLESVFRARNPLYERLIARIG